MRKLHTALLAGLLGLALVSVEAAASPIVAGFNGSTLAANDDGSTGAINLGFNFNYFGTTYTQTYVNNNGNVTFGGSLGTYTPFGLIGPTAIPIVAPFFADVDTRGAGSGLVTYGTGALGGHSAFGVNWLGVGYYGAHTDKLNSFQLILVDRSDIAAGDADIYFNYGSIQWETGDASGGSNGFGGNSARAGYSAGSGVAGSFAELTGSGVHGAFLDNGVDSLRAGTNDGVTGQFLFGVRAGVVIVPGNPIPEPTSIALFALGLAALGLRRKQA